MIERGAPPSPSPLAPALAADPERLAPVAGRQVAREALRIAFMTVGPRRALGPPQAAEVRPVERFEQGQRGSLRRPRRIGPSLWSLEARLRLFQRRQVEKADLLEVMRPAQGHDPVRRPDAPPRAGACWLRADGRKPNRVAEAAEGLRQGGELALLPLLEFALLGFGELDGHEGS